MKQTKTCNNFNGLNNLTKIPIPPSITSIDKLGFNTLSSLTEIIIPQSVTEIDDYLFSECISLKK